MKKIILTDNYDRETSSEQLVTFCGDETAFAVCEMLNKDPQRNDSNWYVVRDHDYKLYRFEP